MKRADLSFTGFVLSAALSQAVILVSIFYLFGHLQQLGNILSGMVVAFTHVWPLGVLAVVALPLLIVIISIEGVIVLPPMAILLVMASMVRLTTDLAPITCLFVGLAIGAPLLFLCVFLIRRANKNIPSKTTVE